MEQTNHLVRKRRTNHNPSSSTSGSTASEERRRSARNMTGSSASARNTSSSSTTVVSGERPPEYTTRVGQIRSVVLLLTRWVTERDPTSCCPWHQTVDAMSDVLISLTESQCYEVFSSIRGKQCICCGIVCHPKISSRRCEVCMRQKLITASNTTQCTPFETDNSGFDNSDSEASPSGSGPSF